MPRPTLSRVLDTERWTRNQSAVLGLGCLAVLALLSTIGRLNAQELAVASLVYDPDAYYHDVRRKWFDISITHSDGRREVLQGPHVPVK